MITTLRTAVMVPFFCLGMAATSHAAVMDLGSFSGTGSRFVGNSGLTSSFSDFYNFSLAGSSSYNVNLAGFNISGFAISLYKGVYNSGPSSLVPTTSYTSSPSAGVTFSGQQALLGSGSYYFNVSGVGNSAGSSYGGQFAVSAVPLPPALPMFGAALLALISFGVMSRRGGSRTIA